MLGAWVVVIAAGGFAAGFMKISHDWSISGSESQHASNVLEDKVRGEKPPTETVVIQSTDKTFDDPQYAAFVDNLVAKFRAMPDTVAAVTSPTESGEASLVSADRKTVLVPVVLTGEFGEADSTVAPLLQTLDVESRDGFTVLSAGDGSISRTFNETAEKDLAAAEKVGLPVALLVLVFVFGAAVAAGVPVVLGVLGILLSVGITAIISQLLGGVDSSTTNMISMIGLAVGIDYTLFIVERFREERRNGCPVVEAIETASDTASRAVLFSGMTVVIGLLGLFLVPSVSFKGMAIGAMTAVLSAVAIALTLLPAILRLLGDRINWLTLPFRRHKSDDTTRGFWNRTTALVMKHPVVFAVGSTLALVAMSLPYWTIKLGQQGVEELPPGEAVSAYRVIDQNFAAGRVSPTDIVIEADDVTAPTVQAGIAKLEASIAQDGSWGPGTSVSRNQDGTVAVVTVFGEGDFYATPAQDAINRLRDEQVPAAFAGIDAKVTVGGETASTVDYIDTMGRSMPIVFGFVLSLSFLLLMVVFRSIILPAKAIVMNLLSVGAAYGAVVAVFQHGFLAGPLGMHQSDTIAAFLPVFLFTILFGLSMDYHVFLLSRIQEHYHEHGDNSAAVAHGMRSTSGIITGAAAIMVAVFGGFAMGDLVAIQQVGLGLAVAVFLDATIVRTLLVPSSMQLLGKWNWYLPSKLHWLPRISVEGSRQPHRAPATGSFDYGAAPAGGE
ncbi:MAG TPA: MMPL family transporter [Tepidiformaceae bacterium]|nr:MMPL family transporter [Tepidiformaceae bacterium]